ncbi:hypothetical protein Sjap_011441 [Stephania japonica]|uniref:RING-type domain-containing protein n=1 Tax=Stephania japonica TaxID=461633 RepID=A0AAP0JBM9_9MAGN
MSRVIVSTPIDLDEHFDLDLALVVPTDEQSLTTGTMTEQNYNFDAEVANMPTVWIADTCAVCMEKIDEEKSGKRMACCHVFHASCLSTWLARRGSCPLCRRCVAKKPNG